jgi:hypothetical protein
MEPLVCALALDGTALELSFAEEVRASLPRDRILFRYFKDRYALQLLAYAAAEWRTLAEMRRGRFGPLLQKPAVRRIFGTRGGRGMDWELLDSYFPRPTEDYELTFGLWGGNDDDRFWNQTTRPGFNLVVQLNLPASHNRAYRKYIEPGERHPFEFKWHPIHHGDLHTLAWSRLDIDLECGEGLIEEVQSDWIRNAEAAGQEALASLSEGEIEVPEWLGDVGCDALQLFRYVEHVLSHHRKIWDQAVLAASLWLLREQLGIRRIFMHTYESGCVLKNIDEPRPPRSLYERLPRSFCFEKVGESPRFLREHLSRWPVQTRSSFWFLRV